MKTQLNLSQNEERLWDIFVSNELLTEKQQYLFMQYYQLLCSANTVTNLTTIIDFSDVLDYHFRDSLAVRHYGFWDTVTGIADVGTGAGFPGIALKIIFPDLPLILIEVNQKKVDFLKNVIEDLDLKEVIVVSDDWRTFLRQTTYEGCNFFVSRAALPVSELIRLFSPLSFYKGATCCYWASEKWVPTVREKPFVSDKKVYSVGVKNRALIFLKKPVK